jgi:hypothetical protein
MIRACGLDDAIVGVGQRCGSVDVIVYDAQKIVDIFVERDGMNREEAWEFFEFNVLGAYVGEATPIYLLPLTLQEIEEAFYD